MSVLDRSALEDSPLADLHALASELGIDGFRRLRRPVMVQGHGPLGQPHLESVDVSGVPLPLSMGEQVLIHAHLQLGLSAPRAVGPRRG